MSDAKSTVEINGKIYNMKDGQVLGASQNSTKKIDGFIGQPSDRNKISHQHKVNRSKVNNLARKPAKSSTLMRHVSRPARQHVTSVKKPRAGEFIARKGAVQPKSHMISKFHKAAETSNQTTHSRIKPIHTNVAVQKPSNAEQFARHAAHLTIKQLENQFHDHVADPFEEAIKEASSHVHELHSVEAPLSRAKKLLHPFGSKTRATLTTIIIVSIFSIGVYQTVPAVKLKMASIKASIPASLPAYRPAGFGIAGPLQAEPGKVTVTYKSNSNDASFKITQQASNWSSQSLLNNQVLASSKPFQTYQQNGKTVYIYANNNVVWVNGGILYSIEGNEKLNPDQLLKIAESL